VSADGIVIRLGVPCEEFAITLEGGHHYRGRNDANSDSNGKRVQREVEELTNFQRTEEYPNDEWHDNVPYKELTTSNGTYGPGLRVPYEIVGLCTAVSSDAISITSMKASISR